MRGAACEHENPGDARFCNCCGAALVLVCGRCDRQNPPGAQFCNGCGVPLDDATPADPVETPAAEAPPRNPRDYPPHHLGDRLRSDPLGSYR